MKIEVDAFYPDNAIRAYAERSPHVSIKIDGRIMPDSWLIAQHTSLTNIVFRYCATGTIPMPANDEKSLTQFAEIVKDCLYSYLEDHQGPDFRPITILDPTPYRSSLIDDPYVRSR